MSMELKAELVMAVRGYECEERESWKEGVDFTASDSDSDEKILLRVITDPKSNSGIVGVEAVRRMAETINQEEYDGGVLISERFSEAAKREIRQNDFLMVSDKFMPSFTPQKLYLTTQGCMNDLCKIKCGKIPEKETDCRGKDSEGNYPCKIRLISDNASFHFEHCWTNLLKEDLMQLLTLRKSMGAE